MLIPFLIGGLGFLVLTSLTLRKRPAIEKKIQVGADYPSGGSYPIVPVQPARSVARVLPFLRAKQEVSDEDIKDTVGRDLASASSFVISPLTAVTDDQWREFVRWARRGKLGTITGKYELGSFLITPHQLADHGYMRSIHKTEYCGKEIYNGEWCEPYSRDAFLSSPAMQYEVFCKLTLHRVSQILTRHVIDDEYTLSGLLAVATVVGMLGLDKWRSDKPGKRFEKTTQAFNEMNRRF